MAAPSLQTVLAAVPALVEQIDGMTELVSGVPASEEHLRTLWQHVNRVKRATPAVQFDSADGMRVSIDTISKRKGEYQDLRVIVQGKPENCRRDDRTHQFRPYICDETKKNTGEGLLQCLLFARQSLKRYRDEGPCPACMSGSDAAVAFPVKKLKAIGMPRCEDCMMAVVIGASESDCKRARRTI